MAPVNIDMLPHASPRIPVLGDITSIDRHRPTQHEAKLVEQLGEIYERKVLSTRLTIVGSARLAQSCSSEQSWARALAGPGLKLRQIGGSGMFTARTADPLWSQARAALNPGFAQGAMRAYHDAMNSVGDDVVAAWSRTDGSGATIAVHEAMTNATLETIARAAFSRPLGLYGSEGADAEAENLIATLGSILRWASESSNNISVIGAIRSRINQARFADGLARLRRFIDELVSERQEGRSTGRADLLDLMLTGDHQLPATNIRDQVMTFLIAGHETTAALLETALWYLADRPDLLHAIRDEALARGFGYESVAGMRRTRQVLNEVLRLWPPVPAYFRIAREAQSLGGFDIPAGHLVSVLVLAAHRDPQAWGPDAHGFTPERWRPAALRAHPDRFFSPFGTGPRSCIGRAFAMQEATLLIARIALDFDLAFPSGIERGTAPVMLERGTLRPAPYELVARRISE
ncbi:MAG: cytochrome P450 [Gordonia sp. (in: high G+C Gram-positive bacteria)]